MIHYTKNLIAAALITSLSFGTMHAMQPTGIDSLDNNTGTSSPASLVIETIKASGSTVVENVTEHIASSDDSTKTQLLYALASTAGFLALKKFLNTRIGSYIWRHRSIGELLAVPSIVTVLTQQGPALLASCSAATVQAASEIIPDLVSSLSASAAELILENPIPATILVVLMGLDLTKQTFKACCGKRKLKPS